MTICKLQVRSRVGRNKAQLKRAFRISISLLHLYVYYSSDSLEIGQRIANLAIIP